jgi:hypothetical protein
MQEIPMKKFLIATVTLVMLSSASFAETSTENRARMEEMHHQFMMMTDQMIETQMQTLKMQENMLTNFQRLLKQMMENESSTHSG